jgi:zinc/manganese transport system permease protein
VQIAGVLLVFSYLIVPAAIAALLTQSVIKRLALGWTIGFIVSILGLVASAAWDLPTGATVVTTFGALMAAIAACLGLASLIRRIQAEGPRALAGAGIAIFVVAGLAGLLLLIFPRMDHHWLNWLEKKVPALELVFLDSDERETYKDSTESVQRGLDEMVRLRIMQQEVQWGRREMSEEKQERLRQYLAGRSELTTGDRLTLDYLRGKARERQRLWLAIPLVLIGATGVSVLLRLKRGQVAQEGQA